MTAETKDGIKRVVNDS